jgi:hypothetical protein
MTKTPELVLDADESRPLAMAVCEVAKHYDIPGLDEKTTAWVGLIMVCGKIYVPRAVMAKQRIEQERKERKPSNVLTVVPKQENKPSKPPKKAQEQREIDPLAPPLGFPV